MQHLHNRARPVSRAAQEECISRKKFFNMMEDMKGKIRVYARVRPMLSFEQDRGHRNALNIPDELTLDHIWKDKKREYNFDAVFAPDASQDKVCFLLLLLKVVTVLLLSSTCLEGTDALAQPVRER